MHEIEEALRILGLKAGASFSEVMQAQRDLEAIWDPSRFDDNPRLKKKALDHLARIQTAFETLRSHHHAGTTATVIPQSRIGQQEGGNPRGPAPALYDEILSGTASGPGKNLPLGWLAAGGAVLIILIGYLVSGSGEDRPRPPSRIPDQASPAPGSIGNTTSQELLPVAPDASSGPLIEPQTKTLSAESAGPKTKQPAETLLQPPSDTVAPPPRDPVARQRDTGPAVKPVLERPRRARETEVRAGEAAAEAEPAAREDTEDELSNQAFDLLRQKMAVVEQMVEGSGPPGLRYHQWKAVQKNPPEVWIDVVAHRSSGGAEVHLVWSVNTETGVVTPLSHAARELASEISP